MGKAGRITALRLRELIKYNRRTGAFTWRVDRMCGRYGKQFAARAGDRAGSITKDGRVQLRVDGRNYKAHLLAWLYVTGAWPESEIDHKDTDATNNKWSNLREATRSVNNQNIRRAKRGNLLGVLGVKRHRNRYVAQLCVGGKNKHLGSFTTPQEAHAAYVAAKRIHHKGCTL